MDAKFGKTSIIGGLIAAGALDGKHVLAISKSLLSARRVIQWSKDWLNENTSFNALQFQLPNGGTGEGITQSKRFFKRWPPDWILIDDADLIDRDFFLNLVIPYCQSHKVKVLILSTAPCVEVKLLKKCDD